MTVLRDGLLADRAVAIAGTGDRVAAALASLGARVERFDAVGLGEDEERVGDWAREQAPLDAVVYDARDAISGGLTAALEQAWVAVREVAVGALIPGDRPAKVVLIAPRDGGGADATAMRAGLENLARTLSVEWARYGITTVAITPRPDLDEQELVELVCFLCSPGGEYFSGCRLDLGQPSPEARF